MTADTPDQINRVRQPPTRLTMYWCDGCPTFKAFNPMKHRIPPSGTVCKGTVHPIEYVRAEPASTEKDQTA